jgi:hypothetical protein
MLQQVRVRLLAGARDCWKVDLRNRTSETESSIQAEVRQLTYLSSLIDV